jgi:DNA ligase 1
LPSRERNGKQFLSRLGNTYLAPDWFSQGLPEVPLDGELWVGRKMFQKTTSIVRRSDKSDEWKKVAYVVFDAPSEKGPFETRLEFCRHWMENHSPVYARWHEHVPCEGLDHLTAELARVEALGGEGLMLRQPGSTYEVGRSHTLLKVKTFHDAEAKVVAHVSGAGKHKGRLGALMVEMPDGTQFSVGTGLSDAERESPPPIGAVITYRYQELSDGGVPRFPSYIGVRGDVAFKSTKPAAIPKPSPPSSEKSPQPSASIQAAPTAAPTGAKRRFEFVQGTSSKYWEISVNGAQHIVHYGRLGTNGQERLKCFADAAEADRDAQRLIAEKTKEGYLEKPTS